MAGIGRHLAVMRTPSAEETSGVFEGEANEDG